MKTERKRINLQSIKIDPTIALRISPNFAHRRKLIPFAAVDGTAYVATLSPPQNAMTMTMERLLNLPVKFELAEPSTFTQVLIRIYGDRHSITDADQEISLLHNLNRLDVEALDTDQLVQLSETILNAAALRQASDIHVDPGKEQVRIRFRVDGQMEEYQKLPMALHSGLISRYKVLGGMDIAEKRAAQDGSFRHQLQPSNQQLDIRSATLPTRFGERLTLRLLAMNTELLTLENLGMSTAHLKEMETSLNHPHGIILLSGPTGSGKSTTLYASIRRLLQRQQQNIITIENPIEYEMDGVAQVETDAIEKVSFAKALRSVLRHDPDVIMVGEIRDAETAGIAIKASLTGHLVLSTVHTNSAPTVITRLHDMGVERYLVADTLRLAIAQRLVRKLCEHCRQARPMTRTETESLNCPENEGKTVFEPSGCKYCTGRGYVGRIALFEFLPITSELASEIANGIKAPELESYMKQKKMTRLIDDAMEKVFSGQTAVREILPLILSI